ncbi:hypothetical protein [Xanthomonas arboricola]|uniref:hypothetical protein n=1 Tax=Xanthomonas arboricola TaxID=56448 RepID=UPI000CEE44F3|nr:hypothetical protein [Xanthomonas arboricola]PPU38272.1 hypothetical protein XaplCFBP3123_19020 [Xanthomonas arboricola pv. populi]
MPALPPPLPPPSSASPAMAPALARAPGKRRSGVTLGLIGLAACVVLFGMVILGALGWLIVFGWSLFADQARAALQDDAVVQEQIGRIHTMRVDLVRTGLAPGDDDFVFTVEGDRGRGRVHATWVSGGSEREILSDGVLTMHDGSEYTLPSADAADTDPDTDPDSADTFEE